MLRRKKDSTLNGQQLVVLPPKTVELRVLEFSPEERDICMFFPSLYPAPDVLSHHHMKEVPDMLLHCPI